MLSFASLALLPRATKIGAVLAALLIGSHAAAFADDFALSIQTEIVFWQSIEDSTNADDFEAYLREFPSGVFRDLAINRLAILDPAAPLPPAGENAPLSSEQEALPDLDIVFWSSIKDSKDPKDFAAYLNKFPDGIFRALAKHRQNELNS